MASNLTFLSLTLHLGPWLLALLASQGCEEDQIKQYTRVLESVQCYRNRCTEPLVCRIFDPMSISVKFAFFMVTSDTLFFKERLNKIRPTLWSVTCYTCACLRKIIVAIVMSYLHSFLGRITRFCTVVNKMYSALWCSLTWRCHRPASVHG